MFKTIRPLNSFRSNLVVLFAITLAVVSLGCNDTSDDGTDTPKEPRTIDGSGNNRDNPSMGMALTQLFRLVFPDYSDGASGMAGADRPGARLISNIVNDQEGSIPNTLGSSDYLWQWGQFLDHDIDLTENIIPPEPADIPVPPGDPFFDPEFTGTQVIFFNRSLYDPLTGTTDPRQQLNQITSWIDASNVYGSDSGRAFALRTNDGTGRLRTSEGDLLPFNTAGLPNAGGDDDTELFLAGDVRANEQVGLTAMHTLFVREHNRLAQEIAAGNPELNGDEIYEGARRIVGAQMQAITYNEFIPALLGEGALEPYTGYDPDVNGSVMNLFSTASFRLGHSLLSPVLLRLDSGNNTIPEGNLELRDAFFIPERIRFEGGIDPLLRGLAAQPAQKLDIFIVDGVRNFLFGAPGQGGFDLASLNIQRGRDHGLPSYNDVREQLGLVRKESFADISSDPGVQARLEEAYGDVDSIDVWVGGLAEDPLPGSHAGELIFTVLKIQFESLRDGDRYWYQIILSGDELSEVENTLLSDIIRRNTGIGGELRDDVFRIP